MNRRNIIIIFLYFATSVGGSYSTNNELAITILDRRNDFIALFEERVPPIIIDSLFLANYSVGKNSEFDTSLVSMFIDKNSKIDNTELFNYYPLYKIKNKNVFLIIKNGGSGGREMYIYMNEYDKDFKLKSSRIISKYIADCSFAEIREAYLYKESDTEVIDLEYSVNCITEISILKHSKKTIIR